MTDRTTERARRALGGDGLPARIASRTVKRVLRLSVNRAELMRDQRAECLEFGLDLILDGLERMAYR